MATNAETVQQIKESLISLKDNPTTVKAVSKFKEQREKLLFFINKHKKPVIIVSIIITILSIYLFVFHNRINKYLNRMDVYDTNNIVSMQYNQEIMNGNFKLCDFYISSSYKSYLPCTNYYDYS